MVDNIGAIGSRYLFALKGDKIIISNRGDRRTHFEWLSSMYIGYQEFKTMYLGYFYEDTEIICLFKGNILTPINEIKDILLVVKSFLEATNRDTLKAYLVYNGITSDFKPIVKLSVNIGSIEE